MRLGQLARKQNISIQKMIEYLDKKGIQSENLNYNSKLDPDVEELLVRKFSSEPEETTLLESEVEVSDNITVIPKDEEEQLSSESDAEEPIVKKEISIKSDELLELLEDEDAEIDLEEITVIKAPKKELDGLKVVGKVELPEPKKKTIEDFEEENVRPRKPLRQEKSLSEEELEERRLRAKRKKEAYEARKEKRRKKAEEKKKKAKKEAHYRKKIEGVKPKPVKSKRNIAELQDMEQVKEIKKPRTWLGKFIYWLNNPD